MHSRGCLMDDPYIDNTTERSMDEQTRKALELARDALQRGDTYDREHAVAAIDAALSAPAAPVAQPLTKTEFARLWRERMGATRFGNYEWEAKQITERAHGIGQVGAA